MQRVKSYRELEVYRQAFKVQQDIFDISKQWPRIEDYALTDQIRRSSRSVGANIAEAWAKRRYEAHFISKLTDADGEQYETQHWLETVVECGYLEAGKGAKILGQCKQIGRLLGGMIEKANLFCGKTALEIR